MRCLFKSGVIIMRVRKAAVGLCLRTLLPYFGHSVVG